MKCAWKVSGWEIRSDPRTVQSSTGTTRTITVTRAGGDGELVCDAIRFAPWLSDKSGHKFRLRRRSSGSMLARVGTHPPPICGAMILIPGCQRSRSAPIVPNRRYWEECLSAVTKPSAFGLHDMLGNVWEWTASIYDASYSGGELRFADAGSFASLRVNRGGTWFHPPTRFARGATQHGHPEYRVSHFGFPHRQKPPKLLAFFSRLRDRWAAVADLRRHQR